MPECLRMLVPMGGMTMTRKASQKAVASGDISEERRSVPRSLLEPMSTITLHNASSSSEFLCTLENISPLGFKAELLCGVDFSQLPLGEALEVACCDEALQDLMQSRRLEMIWREKDRAGFQFESALPLKNHELEERLDRQRLLPWRAWQC